MKTIKLKITMLAIICFATMNVFAQEVKPIPENEIGFSVGMFPTIGAFFSPDKSVFPVFSEPLFSHSYKDSWKSKNGSEEYYKMYHLGSYTFNYNYHFNARNSIGVSTSWVGKHIDRYQIYEDKINDTVNGSGWNHYITFQINYRYTYYRENNVSLYSGIYVGLTECFRDKNITPKRTHEYLLGTVSNARYYFGYAMHINAFGVEIGKQFAYIAELGFGTQGVLKVGFRYKF